MTQAEILEKVQFQCELRGLSRSSAKNYQLYARLYQEHFEKPADELGIGDFQQYMHYLRVERGYKKASVSVVNGALRFLYRRVLEIPLDYDKIPRLNTPKPLPEVLTREEVKQLVEHTNTLRNRCLLMTAYSAGLRVSEVAALRVQDIDSAKMQIFIQASKGGKERFAILSPNTLELLRKCWKETRPREYLFYPRYHKERHLTVAAVQKIFGETKARAGITKHVTMHSLRHSFATHLLEDGAGIYQIKQLLGHSKITTCCIYLHLLAISEMNVQSPADKLFDE